MVDKVSVNPLEVRGAGDIVSPKTLSDFNGHNSKIVSAEEEVNGTTMTVYTESYLSGSYMTVTAPKYVNIGTESATISAVLKYIQTGSLINSATVNCYVNDLLIESKSTDGNGVVSFTIPVTDTVGEYTVKLRYAGNINVAGCFAVVRFYQYDITDLNLIGDKPVIQSGDTCNLIATLTGTGVNGETIPIPGQTVSIYEEYSPALGISADKSIIQSGETANISLQLKDAEDGSLVRESGLTIGLYKEGALFKASGEYTHSYNEGQNVTVLSDVISKEDLTNHWKLSFDLKSSIEGRIFIGDSTKAVPTNPQNSIFMGRDTKDYVAYGIRITLTRVKDSQISSLDYNFCEIEYNNGSITYYINGEVVGQYQYSEFSNISNVVLGTVSWGDGVFYVKNILWDTVED